MGRIKNFIRNINYLTKHSLWDQREEDIVYLTDKILEDAKYEYGLDDGYYRPRILDKEQSLELILKSGKSFVRTGDGEVKIMMGMDQGFQRYEPEIADGLRKMLSEPNDNLLVGINRNYFIPGYMGGGGDFYRRHAYDYRQYYKKILNEKITYIDATCTGYALGNHADAKTIEHYDKWVDAFKDRNLIIVCGQGILDKLEYDVFEKAKSKKFIYGPAKHAWDKHEELINQIKKEPKENTVIVFILGMAGKVMISELADMGYTCWDVGHLAKYYDALKRGVSGSKENVAKFYAPD